ncbi:MAG: HutP family protein [Turicibacter sp.]
MAELKSIDVAKATVRLAMTGTRSEEERLVKLYRDKEIYGVAVDIGGNLIQSIPKIIERSIMASRRSQVILESHVYEGAVAGAARDAIMQVAANANGLSAGGKIAIARHKEHLSVCIFLSIGLLHLDDVVIGLAHRSVPDIIL